MTHKSLRAGQAFPDLSLPKLGGGQLSLTKPNAPYDWKLIVVYRGKHCPLCTRYLGEINQALPELNALGIDVAAISADPEDKAQAQIDIVNPDYDIGYDLTLEQMQTLGLYISNPRSPEETDRPFAEPGFFVINAEGNIQIIDISNAPFARPDLKSMIMGLGFIRNPENNYPIRGAHYDA